MDQYRYAEIAAIEDRYWWHAARRSILRKVLNSLHLGADALILEAGCGSGGNLSLLSEYGTLRAFEPNDTARDMANRRNLMQVEKGALPSDIPFSEKFDLIVLLDVLEHIEDDRATLERLQKHLKSEGRILLTVPAFQFLWSGHDVSAHHQRRYTFGDLREKLQKVGFSVEYGTYFNTVLLPAVFILRKLQSLYARAGGERRIPPWPLNRLLISIFSCETLFLPKFRFPFGVSLLMIARPAWPAQGHR